MLLLMSNKTPTKLEKPKGGRLKTWLEAKPHWEQYLWQLHLQKNALSEADFDKCYQYLLEDSGVDEPKPGRVAAVFPAVDLDATETPSIKYTLDKIENLR